MAQTKDMAEIVEKVDAFLDSLGSTAKMTAQSVNLFNRSMPGICCTWIFLDEWLEQHRRLIRHAYRYELAHFGYWKLMHYPHEYRKFKMSSELRALCAEYLKMRKGVRP